MAIEEKYNPSITDAFGTGENLRVRENQMKFNSADLYNYLNHLDSVLGAEIGQITSRDQIIDPYALIDFSNYRNTKKGQALYNADLQRAQRYAEMQEAAYQEWFNSEAQQASRQREAGVNPSLNGLESSTAADTSPSETSPLAGIGTTEETIGTVVGAVATTVGTIVSAVATLGALPATIGAALATAASATRQVGLIGAQTEATQIASAKDFEALVYSGLGAKLATARQSALDKGEDFNFDDWINGDHSDVFSAYAPDGVDISHKRYGYAFQNAVHNFRKYQSEANKINTDASESDLSWAQIQSDPYLSSDERYMVAMFKPLSDYMREADKIVAQTKAALAKYDLEKISGLDGQLAAQAINADLRAQISEAGYNKDYYDKISGEKMAIYQQMQTRANALIVDTNAQIKSHFRDIWNNSKLTIAERMGALFMLMDDVPKTATSWMTGYLSAHGLVDPNAPTPPAAVPPEERLHGDMTVTPLDNLGYNLGANLFK